jgi:hypothetical protein
MTILLVLVYPVQMLRIYKKSTSDRTQYEKSLYAIFCVLAKLPLMLGQVKFSWNALMGKKSTLIEYK